MMSQRLRLRPLEHDELINLSNMVRIVEVGVHEEDDDDPEEDNRFSSYEPGVAYATIHGTPEAIRAFASFMFERLEVEVT